jgi:murein DD-endopeptidase MepM/ murein hydrolase activator NlpD
VSYPSFSQSRSRRSLTRYASRFRLKHTHWIALSVAIFGGTALLTYTANEAQAKRSTELTQGLLLPNTPPGVADSDHPFAQQADAAALEELVTASITPASLLPAHGTSRTQATASTDNTTWKQAEVKRGDNLALIFSRSGVAAGDLHKVMTQGPAVNTLKRIFPGQTLQLRTDADGNLHELRYEESPTLGLHVVRKGDDFTATSIHRIPDRQTAYASAVIDSSLFMAGQKANLPDNMIMDLAGIFGWDIDFALDLRGGDHFTVLYDELFLDGERIGEGNILAAEFVNQGKVYQAVRYTDEAGRTDYYTPEGHSLRKAFLRTPVEFSRISSTFNLKRKHPILNRIRAHKGVDYAAPQGTPIKVTGDGRVVFRGVKGGYGNVVIVQHGSAYSTLYGHLSGFARSVNTGTRVRQGQTIGYLGMTGLATGPHLHYEFLVNGAHTNPLTVAFPDAMPIDKRFQHDFQKQAQAMVAQLDRVRGRSTQVALRAD